MAINIVLDNTEIVKIIMVFLLWQNMTNWYFFIIDWMILQNFCSSKITVILQIKKGEMDKKCNPRKFFLESFKCNILKKKDEEKTNHSHKKLLLKE